MQRQFLHMIHIRACTIFGIDAVDFRFNKFAKCGFIKFKALFCDSGFIGKRIKNCLFLFQNRRNYFINGFRAKQAINQYVSHLPHAVSSLYCLIFDGRL